MQFNKAILLLGAGFSKNFGGLLARDMWTKILNHPLFDTAVDIKWALRNEFNFETVYSDFFKATDEEKKAQFKVLEKIVKEVYKNMNDKLLHPIGTGVNINSLQNDFINLFTDDGSGGFGACFSLNQDLFFEKFFTRNPLGPQNVWYGNNQNTVNEADLITDKTLPTQTEMEEYKKTFTGRGFGFIKLHGSLNWRMPNGTTAMVIAINKPEIIEGNPDLGWEGIPLLSWYRSLFNQAIQQENIKLVVYGYSFNDDYINKAIRDAIHGGTPERRGGNKMKIYIISPENPSSLKTRLEEKDCGEIWLAVDGYFPYLMKDVFSDTGLKPEYEEIVNKIGLTSAR